MKGVADVFAGSTQPAKRTARPGDAATSFDRLIAQLQTAQVMTASQAASAMTPAASPSDDGKSARRARVDAETDAARQAESDANATRHADPSSVEKGTVSARHERVLAERSDAAQPAMPAPSKDATEPQCPERAPLSQPQAGLKAAQQELPNTPAKTTPPEAPAPQAKDAASAPSPTPTQQPARATESSPLAPPPENSVPAVVAVTTAGAANAAKTSTGGDVAQQIARMLASRAGSSPNSIQPAVSADRGASDNARVNTRPGERPDSAPKPKMPPEPAATQRATFARLVNQLRMNIGAKQSQATIRLSPPDLGRIKVDVKLVNQALRVRVEAETPKARALLGSRAADLTSALREHGLNVERFEIVATGAAPQHADAPQAVIARDDLPSGNPESESSRHHRHDARDAAAGEADSPLDDAWMDESAEDPRLDVAV